MFIRNSEETFNSEDLFYCYSAKLKKFLCNKKVSFIGKGIHDKTKKTYWIFLKTPRLSMFLNEWSRNAENGIKAID